jgi:hypothetical protein
VTKLFASPFESGVRKVCINQLLRHEQITMICLAGKINPEEIGKHIRKLDIVGRLLKAHPYPHRPYYSAQNAKSDVIRPGIAGGRLD